MGTLNNSNSQELIHSKINPLSSISYSRIDVCRTRQESISYHNLRLHSIVRRRTSLRSLPSAVADATTETSG